MSMVCMLSMEMRLVRLAFCPAQIGVRGQGRAGIDRLAQPNQCKKISWFGRFREIASPLLH